MMGEKEEQTTHLINKQYVANPSKYNHGDIVTVESKARNHEWIVMGEDNTHLHLLALNNTSMQCGIFKRDENLSAITLVKPAEQPTYSDLEGLVLALTEEKI